MLRPEILKGIGCLRRPTRLRIFRVAVVAAVFAAGTLHGWAQALWVSDVIRYTVTEYSYSGIAQRSFPITNPGGNPAGTEAAHNFVEIAGQLWFYNGTFSPYISVFSPSGTDLSNYANGLFHTVNTDGFGGIAVLGTTVFVTRTQLGNDPDRFQVLAYDTASGTSTQLGSTNGTQLCLGQDGLLYVMDNSSDQGVQVIVYVYDPATLTAVRQIILTSSVQIEPSAITTLANGHLIIANLNGLLQEYNSDGTVFRQLSLTQTDEISVGNTAMTSVALGGDGCYLVGSSLGDIYVVTSDLSSYTHFNPSSPFNDPNYVAAVTGPFGPLLTEQVPAQSATYGEPFQFIIPAATFTDPDPAPSVSISAANLPPGLVFTPASLTISGIPSATGPFTATVMATDGSGRSASATVAFTVTSVGPTILQPPSSQSSYLGQTVSFSVLAAGSPPLGYQWTFNGAAIGGATSATFSLTDVQPSAAGNYGVTVSNPEGSVASAPATLTVSSLSPPSIVALSGNQTAAAGNTASFWVEASGGGPFGYQWYFNGTPISGATEALLILTSVQPGNAGSYSVEVSNAAGEAISGTAKLTVGAAASGSGPTIASQPVSVTLAPGSTAVFAVVGGGSASPLVFQWFEGGVPIAAATDDLLVLHNVAASSAGNYSCLVSNGFGSVLSSAASLTVLAGSSPGRLKDLSCRADVTGAGTDLIAGFVVGGPGTAGSNTFLIRASGPALSAFGVSSPLPDPSLVLFNGVVEVASDLGWDGNPKIAATAAAVGAFAWTNPASADSALLETLTGGAYTAQVSGHSGDSGIALAEVYDAAASESTSTPGLINISARAQVGTGGSILIAGFVITGNAGRTVLVRASGPALKPFGVTGVLADPRLQLYLGSTLLASDTGWAADTEITSAASSVGAFSWGSAASADSALLLTLAPGAYTAQVAGADGDAGQALIEVYVLP